MFLEACLIASLYAGMEWTYTYWVHGVGRTTFKQFTSTACLAFGYLLFREQIPVWFRIFGAPLYIWAGEFISAHIFKAIFGTFHDVWWYRGVWARLDGTISLDMWGEWLAVAVVIESFLGLFKNASL